MDEPNDIDWVKKQMMQNQAMKMTLQGQMPMDGADWAKEQMRQDQALKMAAQGLLPTDGADWAKEQMRQDQAMKIAAQGQLPKDGADWVKEQTRQDQAWNHLQYQVPVEMEAQKHQQDQLARAGQLVGLAPQPLAQVRQIRRPVLVHRRFNATTPRPPPTPCR